MKNVVLRTYVSSAILYGGCGDVVVILLLLMVMVVFSADICVVVDGGGSVEVILSEYCATCRAKI